MNLTKNKRVGSSETFAKISLVSEEVKRYLIFLYAFLASRLTGLRVRIVRGDGPCNLLPLGYLTAEFAPVRSGVRMPCKGLN